MRTLVRVLILTLMAIAFVNAGAEGSAASGNITLGAPASPQIDDVWIAVIHSSDQVAHTFTDWTQIVQGNGGGTTSRISVWYFRYAGSTPNLVVTHSSGQSPIGGIAAYRGCKTSGSPVDTAGAITGGTDGSIEHAAINPTQANCALLVCNGSADDNNRTALGGDYVVVFEDTAGGAQNCFLTVAGTPDGSVSLFHDILIPDADTGTITVTQAASDAWASVLIALAPDLNQTITAGTPTITITAPAAAASQRLPAGAPVMTMTAPAATISAGGPQTLQAGAPVLTFTAPAATRVAAVSLVAGAPTLAITAPTATRLATISLAAGAPTITITAPTATRVAAVSLLAGTPTITITAPIATRMATVRLLAGTPTITFTAPTATIPGGSVDARPDCLTGLSATAIIPTPVWWW